MTADESLARFGLVPSQEALPVVRQLLAPEVAKERQAQGKVNFELIRLCCVQLFSAGQPADTLLIWSAKEANFDLFWGIDVQLLCGAGLDATKEFLASYPSPDARAALDRIVECQRCGDFDRFTPAAHLQYYRDYYGVT